MGETRSSDVAQPSIANWRDYGGQVPSSRRRCATPSHAERCDTVDHFRLVTKSTISLRRFARRSVFIIY